MSDIDYLTITRAIVEETPVDSDEKEWVYTFGTHITELPLTPCADDLIFEGSTVPIGCLS